MFNPYTTLNREDEREENRRILQDTLKAELKDSLKRLGTALDNVSNAASEYEDIIETGKMNAFWDQMYLLQNEVGNLTAPEAS